MVVEENMVKEDKLVKARKRTMVELRKMANSVHPMIQLEKDFLSKHNKKKHPILDLKLWVVEEVTKDNGKKANMFHQFYRKPMSNRLLIPSQLSSFNFRKTYSFDPIWPSHIELQWKLAR